MASIKETDLAACKRYDTGDTYVTLACGSLNLRSRFDRQETVLHMKNNRLLVFSVHGCWFIQIYNIYSPEHHVLLFDSENTFGLFDSLGSIDKRAATNDSYRLIGHFLNSSFGQLNSKIEESQTTFKKTTGAEHVIFT